jgi:hypothetical protein
MSLRDDPKGWAKAQAEQLRNDPGGWAKTQADRLRGMVDIAPFSEGALYREMEDLRSRVARLAELDPDARQKLHDDLLALHQRLTPGGALISGAKIGLAASVLPVVGMISGPILGSAYGVYRSQQLTQIRDELQDMLRKLARG